MPRNAVTVLEEGQTRPRAGQLRDLLLHPGVPNDAELVLARQPDGRVYAVFAWKELR